MVPRTSYPPIHHHHPSTSSSNRSLPPQTAESTLSTFLNRTQTSAHLHPDSYLSSSGIKFSAHSGPNGGLALHHLKRIAAGLRGENLVQESREELARYDSSSAADVADGDELPEGDDTKLDAVILQTTSQQQRSGGILKNGKGKKRKRIESWAHDTSSQIADNDVVQEIESFANTPMHVPSSNHEYSDPTGWEDMQAYESQQQPLEGEVGGVEREGAPVVKQRNDARAGAPEIRSATNMEKLKGDVDDKQAKKAAKKARREAERRAKGRVGLGVG